ncbi:MAG TPA: prolyl oligopeptidase family serine peptidase [Azospirillaceae bacterium]|nr:prolyl oligopeptidase family serine peptidase [Azospirillaceae bacterium]
MRFPVVIRTLRMLSVTVLLGGLGQGAAAGPLCDYRQARISDDGRTVLYNADPAVQRTWQAIELAGMTERPTVFDHQAALFPLEGGHVAALDKGLWVLADHDGRNRVESRRLRDVHGGPGRVLFNVHPFQLPTGGKLYFSVADEGATTLYALDLVSADITRLSRAEGVIQRWVVDDAGRPLFRQRFTPAGAGYSSVRTVEAAAPGKDGKILFRDDELATFQLGRHGSDYYLVNRLQTETTGMDKVDPSDGRLSRMIRDERIDTVRYVIDPQSGRVHGGILEADEHRFIRPDAVLERIEEGLRAAYPEGIAKLTVAANRNDGREIMVDVTTALGRRDILLYRDHGREATRLARCDEGGRVRISAHRVPARDGGSVFAYLLEPTDEAVAGTGGQVIFIHGGPNDRYWTGANPLAMRLAREGSKVLLVNYRGSEGYGSAYRLAGKGWGVGNRKETDIVDAARWAERSGVFDRDRVALVADSAGAFIAMSVMQNEEMDVGHAFLLSPLFNVASVVAAYDAAGAPTVNLREAFSLDDGRGELAELRLDRRISADVISIFQGEADRITVAAETERVVEKLRALKIDTEYSKIPRAGHSILDDGGLDLISAAITKALRCSAARQDGCGAALNLQ